MLGGERVLVVHSDGLDELSIHAPSRIVELAGGQIDVYDVAPEDFGIQTRSTDDLQADSPSASLALVRAALSGSNDAAADIVALNAGAAIYASGVSTTLANGVTLAQDVIATGQASEKFRDYVDLTRMMGEL